MCVGEKRPSKRTDCASSQLGLALSKVMKSSYLTKVEGKAKPSWVEEHVGAFSDYFIFIVFPLQGPEYVMCIMAALSAAL